MTQVVTRERLAKLERAPIGCGQAQAIADLSSRPAIGLAGASAAVYSIFALVNAVPRVLRAELRIGKPPEHA